MSRLIGIEIGILKSSDFFKVRVSIVGTDSVIFHRRS